jgi:hypoxia up-regulated 1
MRLLLFYALVVAFYALSVAKAALLAIDYGNDWFKVALVRPGNPPLDIVLNRDSKRKTQSILTIRDGERSYGTDAFNLVSYYVNLVVHGCGIAADQRARLQRVLMRIYLTRERGFT